MIQKYKGIFFTEVEAANIRQGDLLSIDGIVGELRSEYDPDFMELLTDRGVSHAVIDSREVKKLKRINHERAKAVPAYPY